MKDMELFVDFDDFETVFGVIQLPAGARFLRGACANGPTIGTWPMYFTHRVGVAQGYADECGPSGVVLTYEAKRPLRLYDFRYMVAVYKDLLGRRTEPIVGAALKEFKEACHLVALSYGTCSLYTQTQILRNMYGDTMKDAVVRVMKHCNETMNKDGAHWKDVVEQPGVRIGESTNDRRSVMIMANIFKGVVDGYICPKMNTPFHSTGYISAECVIFDPSTCMQTVHEEGSRYAHISSFIERTNFLRLYPIANEIVRVYQHGGKYNDTTDRAHAREQAKSFNPSKFFYGTSSGTLKARISQAAEGHANTLKRSIVPHGHAPRAKVSVWTEHPGRTQF